MGFLSSLWKDWGKSKSVLPEKKEVKKAVKKTAKKIKKTTKKK
jgi:hypothetical protein|tara:strand:+ start:587 stop:715 length:129 start_codon:yes stop_codon:yes gene_type:complete